MYIYPIAGLCMVYTHIKHLRLSIGIHTYGIYTYIGVYTYIWYIYIYRWIYGYTYIYQISGLCIGIYTCQAFGTICRHAYIYKHTCTGMYTRIQGHAHRKFWVHAASVAQKDSAVLFQKEGMRKKNWNSELRKCVSLVWKERGERNRNWMRETEIEWEKRKLNERNGNWMRETEIEFLFMHPDTYTVVSGSGIYIIMHAST